MHCGRALSVCLSVISVILIRLLATPAATAASINNYTFVPLDTKTNAAVCLWLRVNLSISCILPPRRVSERVNALLRKRKKKISHTYLFFSFFSFTLNKQTPAAGGSNWKKKYISPKVWRDPLNETASAAYLFVLLFTRRELFSCFIL